jgi:aminoglycoside phosphotransferase (APT) family kinase protein
MSNVIVAPETRELSVLAAQLSVWLKARLPEAEGLSLDNLAYPFGAGQSHETILFDASWSVGGKPYAQGFVVRIKPTRKLVFPTDLFSEQYRLMDAVHKDGRAPVARPCWYEEDVSILGAPFFVMEKVRGRVAVSVPPYAVEGWVAEATPAQRRKLWKNGVRQLAAIQGMPLDGLGFLAGPEGARDGVEQEWERYTRFLAWISHERSWPLLEAAFERLRERWPANQPPGLVWGDARLGNLMVDDDFEIVAVMDWEQPSLGGALHDLGWWLTLSDIMHSTGSGRPHLEGMGTREETIALWGELTGISTADIDWYESFANLKLACLSERMLQLKGIPPSRDAYPDTPLNRRLAKRLDIPWPT